MELSPEEQHGIVTIKVTPAQKALLDWGMEHPYSRICELEFVNGQPMKIVAVTKDGLGTELVRFDKMIGMKR